jgi:hypothetical protein
MNHRLVARLALFPLLSLLTLGACTPAGAPPVDASSSSSPGATVAVAVGGIPASEITGTYTGDWGTMHLVFQGTEARGAYDHADGLFVGTVSGDTIRGRWCQASAQGEAEFRFTRANGTIALDGRWNYSTDPASWKDDWDLPRTAAPNATLASRAATAHCP